MHLAPQAHGIGSMPPVRQLTSCVKLSCAPLVLQDGYDLEGRGPQCLLGGTKPYCSQGKRALAWAAPARASPARPPLATIAPAPNTAHSRPARASCPSSAVKHGKAGWCPQSAQHGKPQPYATQGTSMGTRNAARHTSACQGAASEHATAKQSGSPASSEPGEQAGAGSAHAECGPHGGRGEEVNASESEALEVLASLRMLAAGPGPGPGSGSGSHISGKDGAAAGAAGGALRAGSGRVRKRPVRCPAADASAGEDSSSEDGAPERAACRSVKRPHRPQRAASARAAAAAAARSEAAAEAEARLFDCLRSRIWSSSITQDSAVQT